MSGVLTLRDSGSQRVTALEQLPHLLEDYWSEICHGPAVSCMGHEAILDALRTRTRPMFAELVDTVGHVVLQVVESHRHESG